MLPVNCAIYRINISQNLALWNNLITVILQISIHNHQRFPMAETPDVVHGLNSGLTLQVKSNAAAVLYHLSLLDFNKAMIGERGVLVPLIALLDEGDAFGIAAAANAIHSLCIFDGNRVRAGKAGAVGVIMKKMKMKVQVNVLLRILELFSKDEKSIELMVGLDAVPCFFDIIKNSPSPDDKANSVAILHNICLSDPNTWWQMIQEESRDQPLHKLTLQENTRNKRMASNILARVRMSDQ